MRLPSKMKGAVPEEGFAAAQGRQSARQIKSDGKNCGDLTPNFLTPTTTRWQDGITPPFQPEPVSRWLDLYAFPAGGISSWTPAKPKRHQGVGSDFNSASHEDTAR